MLFVEINTAKGFYYRKTRYFYSGGHKLIFVIAGILFNYYWMRHWNKYSKKLIQYVL